MNQVLYRILQNLIKEKLAKPQVIVEVKLIGGEQNYDESVIRILSGLNEYYNDFDVVLTQYDEKFTQKCFLILKK